VAKSKHEQATSRLQRRRQAGLAPPTRLLLLCAAAVALTFVTAAGAQATSTARLESPSIADIARGSGLIPDATLTRRAASALEVPGTYWGGTFTASTGETVRINVSDRYPQDPTVGQRWANFFASLVHGSELSDLTAYFAPLDLVQRFCGSDALACYSSVQNVLVAPGEDPEPDLSAEAVVTHEYGHHVAAHRSNDPWPAVAFGTKRWSSYEQVCANARSHKYFPGAEQSPLYELNPGEAFAETYRVLNERKAGLAEPSWSVVAQDFYPDATALSLVEQDVTVPWQAATTSTRTSSVSSAKRVRSYTVATPNDGTLTLTLRAPARTRLALDVFSSSTRIGHAAGTGSLSVTRTVCGQRSLRVRVSRISGAGAFRLSIAKP
jgi:hypothetical protein